MAFSNVWNNAVPADTDLANQLGDNVRDVKVDVAERFKAAGGGLIANRETPEADFGEAGKGILYFATDEGRTYQWTGSAWSLVSTNRNFVDSTAVNLTGAGGTQTGNTITIPAGFLVVDSVVEIEARYKYTLVNADGALPELRFGSTVLIGEFGSGGLLQDAQFSATVLVLGASSHRSSARQATRAGLSNASVVLKFASPTDAISGAIVVRTALTGGTTSEYTFDLLIVRVSKL